MEANSAWGETGRHRAGEGGGKWGLNFVNHKSYPERKRTTKGGMKFHSEI